MALPNHLLRQRDIGYDAADMGYHAGDMSCHVGGYLLAGPFKYGIYIFQKFPLTYLK